jgi:hypothetical protein
MVDVVFDSIALSSCLGIVVRGAMQVEVLSVQPGNFCRPPECVRDALCGLLVRASSSYAPKS